MPPISQARPQAPEVTGGPGPGLGPEVIPPLIREQELGPRPPMAEVILVPAPQPWEVTAPHPPELEVTAQLRQALAATTLPHLPLEEEEDMMEVMAVEAALEEVMGAQGAEIAQEGVMEAQGAEVVMEEVAVEDEGVMAEAVTAMAVMGEEEDEEAMVEVVAVAMEGAVEAEEVLVVVEMKRFSQTTRSSCKASPLTPHQRISLSSLDPSA